MTGKSCKYFLLFDYLMVIGITVKTADNRGDAFQGALFGDGYLASTYLGLLSAGRDKYLPYHWLLKTLEGFVLIPFIVVKLTQAHTYSFLLFSIVGIVSFVLQCVPLFYVLKWGSNATKDGKYDFEKCPHEESQSSSSAIRTINRTLICTYIICFFLYVLI